MPVAVIVAMIGAIATIIVAVIGIVPLITGGGSAEVTLKVRVTDRDSVAAISGAKLVLFPAGYVQYSDTNGNATFSLTKNETKDARLFVESDPYDISDQEIGLSRATNNVDIRLTLKNSNDHKVIVRVVDTSTGAPIVNATVVFLVGADPQQQGTDSNGLATFPVTFQGETIDADITVSTKDYTIEHQRLVLRPDTVQDMNLDRNANTLEVKDFKASVPALVQSDSSGSNSISFGQTLSGAITVPGELDRYIFDASSNTAVLIRISKTSGDFCVAGSLSGPDGKVVTSDVYCAGTINLNAILPADGTYTIIIYDYNGAGTGAYAIALQITN